ncbi:hypothetical protein [Streptomyces sp. CA2R101]|uniref:hypothetical protein n=1 Tax=Streptomyces sp. CA2R101 TaxID=3120152 RepID=UPI0030085430
MAVDRILERYAAQLLLTIRQVWYSLVSDGVLVKEERTYKHTVELLGMARRSGRLPWDALRDDTEIRAGPLAYDGPDDFRAGLRQAAVDFRLDRQAGQPVRLEIVCETSRMVPQLVAVADPYGVPVYSGSGFNGLPAKRAAALHAAAGEHRTVRIFVVSDWDPSGVHLFSALAEDVTAFAAVDAPGTEVVFERLAVTEQQIADYQAESLSPDVLAAVLKAATPSEPRIRPGRRLIRCAGSAGPVRRSLGRRVAELSRPPGGP